MTTACATVTQGTTATIAVTTEPPGASCTMSREGAPIAVVNPTPGTVTISRSTRDLSVRCERAGHLPAVVATPAGFQPMTVGNLLIGGVIGLAVDAASGAMGTYPGSIMLTLPPAQFATPESRAGWYANRRQEIDRNAEERIATARAACPAARGATRGAPSACEQSVEFITQVRFDQLRQLDEQERQGVVPPRT